MIPAIATAVEVGGRALDAAARFAVALTPTPEVLAARAQRRMVRQRDQKIEDLADLTRAYWKLRGQYPTRMREARIQGLLVEIQFHRDDLAKHYDLG